MTHINTATPEFVDALRDLLGPQGWRDGPDAAPYLEEQRGRWHGHAALIARPADTAQVAGVVRRCAAARVGIIPYGGGTGLVGGQLTGDGPPPVVLSLERMTAVRRVDPAEGAMIVEAGVVLSAAHAAAAEVDRLFPLSLASEGSARIGGLLSTNAGGLNVLRYGSARDLVLGLEAVMPDGSVLHGLKTLRKDNTGYDLRHLLIGAEGTLGVITAAALRLFARPREVATAFCAVPDPAAASALLRLLRDRLGGTVSAFELLSAQGMAFLAEQVPDTPKPPVPGTWFVLAEAEGGAGSRVGDLLEAGLAEAVEAGLVRDAVLAQSEAQRAAFWRIREDTPEANRRVGAVSSHDMALPLGSISRFIEEARATIAAIDPALRVNCFGHLGDGNLHYNIFPPAGATRADFGHLQARIKRALHDLVDSHHGSVSAEHGIGRLKIDDLVRYGDPVKLAVMRRIKDALDPLGIMNPGAVLPARTAPPDGEGQAG